MIIFQRREEVMKVKIDNPLADRVRKYNWSKIDTVSNDIYDQLYK